MIDWTMAFWIAFLTAMLIAMMTWRTGDHDD